MSKSADVLERKVIHAGTVFIKAGEEHDRAYVIQKGMVCAHTVQDGEQVEVARYGPGTIIGEVCLIMDEPIRMSFEALVDTTVVSITRQDFTKKLSRADSSIKTIVNHMTKKLQEQDDEAILNAGKRAEIDEKAFALVRGLLMGFPEERRFQYEKVLLPHVNGLLKAIRELKKRERHEKQAQALEQKISELEEGGEPSESASDQPPEEAPSAAQAASLS